MDLNQRGATAQEVKNMLACGVLYTEIATYLHKAGCDIGEAVPFMAASCRIRMSQAKSIIFQSPSWAEEGKRRGEFHDQLGDS